MLLNLTPLITTVLCAAEQHLVRRAAGITELASGNTFKHQRPRTASISRRGQSSSLSRRANEMVYNTGAKVLTGRVNIYIMYYGDVSDYAKYVN
jgi:hypothetical protein